MANRDEECSVEYAEVDLEDMTGGDIVVNSDDDDDDEDFDPNNEFFMEAAEAAVRVVSNVVKKAYKFAFGVCMSVKLITDVSLKDMRKFDEHGNVGTPTGNSREKGLEASAGTFNVNGVKSGLSYLITPRRHPKQKCADNFRVVVVWHVYPTVKLAGNDDMVAVGIVTPSTGIKQVLDFIRENERDIIMRKNISGQGVIAIDLVRYCKKCETREVKCQNSTAIVVGHLDQLKKEVVVSITRKKNFQK